MTTPLNPRDFLILMSLSEEPRHGYGLLKDVELLSEGDVRFDPANLYRTLRKMIKQGMVTEMDGPADDTDSRRKYFKITDRGTRTITEEATRLSRLSEIARERNLIKHGRTV